MPMYEYRCNACSKTFSVRQSLAEHDKGNIACPDCKGRQIVQQYSAFFVKTAKKS